MNDERWVAVVHTGQVTSCNCTCTQPLMQSVVSQSRMINLITLYAILWDSTSYDKTDFIATALTIISFITRRSMSEPPWRDACTTADSDANL